MSRDIMSMMSKSKVTKPTARNPKSTAHIPTLKTATPLTISTSKTHRFKIKDEYLIQIEPLHPPSEKSKIITAFDLDSTLIITKSGAKFARGPTDWTWFNDQVIPTLRNITTPIVIFSNQGAVVATKPSKSFLNFRTKCEDLLKELKKGDVDTSKIWIFASPKKSSSYKKKELEHMFTKMRKPDTGMFDEFIKVYGAELDVGECLYIGDAAGRETDFSDSDKAFAKNTGMNFKTPEEFFK